MEDLGSNGGSQYELSSKRQSANLDRVSSIIKERALRSNFFPTEQFSDPAWDILLQLYAAQMARQRVAVSQLARFAVVPETTSLRWLKALDAAGYIIRKADPLDARRVYLLLTSKGLGAMSNYLSAIDESPSATEATPLGQQLAADPLLSKRPRITSLPIRTPSFSCENIQRAYAASEVRSESGSPDFERTRLASTRSAGGLAR